MSHAGASLVPFHGAPPPSLQASIPEQKGLFLKSPLNCKYVMT